MEDKSVGAGPGSLPPQTGTSQWPESQSPGSQRPESQPPETWPPAPVQSIPSVQCAFCGNWIPDPFYVSPMSGDSVLPASADSTASFCSRTCRSAFERDEPAFTGGSAFKRTPTGVAPVDAELPYGVPRNACVLLAGEEGALDAALPAELVWRTLQAGEPAVFVTFNDSAVSVIEQFLLFEWNVLPYLEREQLLILDCFTRHDDPPVTSDSTRSAWVEHVGRFAEGATRTLRDPTDVHELANKLRRCLDDCEMFNSGRVAVDSLTEFGTTVPSIRAHNFLKTIRAEVCKARFVPIFAGATVSDDDGFPLDMTHAVDGRIDLRLIEGDEGPPGEVPPGGQPPEVRLYRQLCVRKMDGVPSSTTWRHVDYAPGRGFFDAGM